MLVVLLLNRIGSASEREYYTLLWIIAASTVFHTFRENFSLLDVLIFFYKTIYTL